MIHDARIVPLDGHPHLPAALRSWLGDSRGRWDGATLVVDTTNFNGRAGVRGSDENLHLVERFTRVDDHDAASTNSPWTIPTDVHKTVERRPADDRSRRIDDRNYACHEGNYALPNILRGARDAGAAAEVETGTGDKGQGTGDGRRGLGTKGLGDSVDQGRRRRGTARNKDA